MFQRHPNIRTTFSEGCPQGSLVTK